MPAAIRVKEILSETGATIESRSCFQRDSFAFLTLPDVLPVAIGPARLQSTDFYLLKLVCPTFRQVRLLPNAHPAVNE